MVKCRLKRRKGVAIMINRMNRSTRFFKLNFALPYRHRAPCCLSHNSSIVRKTNWKNLAFITKGNSQSALPFCHTLSACVASIVLVSKYSDREYYNIVSYILYYNVFKFWGTHWKVAKTYDCRVKWLWLKCELRFIYNTFTFDYVRVAW